MRWMSQQQAPGSTPAVGTISADRQFRWDGREWRPLTGRQRTSWTRPLQLASTAYFVLAPILSVLAITLNRGAFRSTLMKQYQQAGMTAQQAGTLIDMVTSITIGFTIALAIVFFFVGFASWRGWTWAFWVAMILLAFGAIGIAGSASSVMNPSQTVIPTPWNAAQLVAALVALGLFIWFVVAAVRFGPWATTKPGASA